MSRMHKKNSKTIGGEQHRSDEW